MTNVYTVLNAIQKELKAPKSQYNSFGKYHYRSCEDILEAVKPLLGDCVLTITDDIVLIGNRFYVKATARLSSSNEDYIENTAFAREADDKKGMDESQITGSTSSYARKYALNGLFCIDDTKDADTTNIHESALKIAKPKPTPAPQTNTNNILLERAQSFEKRLEELGKVSESDSAFRHCNTLAKQLADAGLNEASEHLLECLDKHLFKIEELDDKIPDFDEPSTAPKDDFAADFQTGEMKDYRG